MALELNHRPIRVGFVVHLMQVAGAEVLVRETIRRLENHIIPTIFCLDAVGRMGEELVAQGVDIVCLKRTPGLNFGVSRRMAQAARERKIDVIHAHQYTPFFYSAFAKLLMLPMPKLILTEHGRHFPDIVSPIRRAFNRIVMDRIADAVNACCEFSARDLGRVDGFRGNRIEVIENGIEIEQYGPAPDIAAQKLKMKLDPTKRYISHVARQHPVKDQATLIKAYAIAAKRFPDVDLLLVGDGELRQQLEDLSASLGLRDRVHFVGIQKNVPEWLRASEVFAMTSVTEAASLTLMEAMATGLPSVVSRVGGNGELVRHEIEGLHFERADVAGCGAAFCKLLGSAELSKKLGDAARARAVERYRLENTINAYYDLYRKLSGI